MASAVITKRARLDHCRTKSSRINPVHFQLDATPRTRTIDHPDMNQPIFSPLEVNSEPMTFMDLLEHHDWSDFHQQPLDMCSFPAFKPRPRSAEPDLASPSKSELNSGLCKTPSRATACVNWKKIQDENDDRADVLAPRKRRYISSSSTRTASPDLWYKSSVEHTQSSESAVKKFGIEDLPWPVRARSTLRSTQAITTAHIMPLDSPFATRRSSPHIEEATTPTSAPTTNVPAQQSSYLLTPISMTISPGLPSPETWALPAPAPRLLQYLSRPDHVVDPRLVIGIQPPPRKTHAWFDVRNTSLWQDFDISSVLADPQASASLDTSIPLPEPARPASFGVPNQVVLQRHINSLCLRVNNALAVAQGASRMTIMTLDNMDLNLCQADFVTRHCKPSKHDPTAKRARVVGVLRASNIWSSAMRNGHELEQRAYLAGLSDLHQIMRDNNCRYGFIINEVELICVRYETTPEDRRVPYYGSLELSAPIALRSTSLDPAKVQLTAGLALFYLNMLAQDEPLDEQFHWALELADARDCSRRIHKSRASWMPHVLKSEERTMRTMRKWAYPGDKITKEERSRKPCLAVRTGTRGNQKLVCA